MLRSCTYVNNIPEELDDDTSNKSTTLSVRYRQKNSRLRWRLRLTIARATVIGLAGYIARTGHTIRALHHALITIQRSGTVESHIASGGTHSHWTQIFKTSPILTGPRLTGLVETTGSAPVCQLLADISILTSKADVFRRTVTR